MGRNEQVGRGAENAMGSRGRERDRFAFKAASAASQTHTAHNAPYRFEGEKLAEKKEMLIYLSIFA